MARRVNVAMKVFTALSIVLVVAGHSTFFGGLSGPFDLFMFKGYHVACFVFVSGYFYKTSYEQEPLVYIKRRVMRLLVPLLLINAVYGAIYVLVGKSGLVSFCDTGSVTWKSFVIHPFTTGHQFRFNLATWFIAPLFTLEVLNVLCRSALTVLGDHLDERTTETAFLVLYLCLAPGG